MESSRPNYRAGSGPSRGKLPLIPKDMVPQAQGEPSDLNLLVYGTPTPIFDVSRGSYTVNKGVARNGGTSSFASTEENNFTGTRRKPILIDCDEDKIVLLNGVVITDANHEMGKVPIRCSGHLSDLRIANSINADPKKFKRNLSSRICQQRRRDKIKQRMSDLGNYFQDMKSIVSSLKSSVEYWQYQNSKIQQENAALELRLQAQSKMAQLSTAVNEFLNSEKERLQKRVMELDLMNKKLTTLNGPVSNSNRLSPQPITNMGISSSILIHQRIQPIVEIGRNPDPSRAEEHKVELSNLSEGPRSVLPEPCSAFGSELDLPPETEHLKLDLHDREEFDMDLFNLLESPSSYVIEPTSIPGPHHDLLAGLSSHAIEPTFENGPTHNLPQGEESDTEWLTWLLD